MQNKRMYIICSLMFLFFILFTKCANFESSFPANNNVGYEVAQGYVVSQSDNQEDVSVNGYVDVDVCKPVRNDEENTPFIICT